jgi:hypothetical protein
MAEAKDTMVELHPLFAKLGAMSPQELESRRRDIVASAQGDPEKLSDEALEELCFITTTLRKRSAGPPKAKAAPKIKATIEGLLEF